MLSPNCPKKYLQAKQYSCERLGLLLEGLETLLEAINGGSIMNRISNVC
jgi:hypothetical protein